MLFLIMMFNLLCASDQLKSSLSNFEKCMSSTPVYWYSKYIVGPFINIACPISNEDASSKYQRLGKQAQLKMGIEESRIVPIKRMTSEYSAARDIQASAQPDAIYVYEDELEKHKNSYQWQSALHEATHHKFNHVAFPFLLFPLVGACIIFDAPLKFVTPKILSESGKISRTIVNGLLLYFASKKIYEKSNRYFEQRADTHALLHLDCYQCCEEVAETRGNESYIHERGYLNSTDIMKFAQKYKEKNMLCEKHSIQ